MSQILVNNLTFSYDGSAEPVFENAAFSIDTAWKLGLIGRNGKGKTTFLRLLTGAYSYQGTIAASVRFAYFPYHLTEAQMHQPAAEFAEMLRPDCEEWRVICELSALREAAWDLSTEKKHTSASKRTVRTATRITGVFFMRFLHGAGKHMPAVC